jgi:hypothetical protein
MALANEEELARLQQQVIDEFRTLGRVTPETSRALHDAQTEIENFNFKVEVGTKVIGKLGDAVANTAKAMYRGEKGASAFNQSVTDLADAAQIAAVGLSLLIPGGPIMKAVVAGLTYLGTSALKAGTEIMKTASLQSDSLYNAFQKMSKVGAAGSDGLTGVFNDVQKLGLGIQDLDGYINLLNDSSQDLAMFRGNVTAGRRAFADMNKEMAPFTEQLYNAGLSQEDIVAGAMGYLKIQTMTGQAQTKTSTQLAEGAKKYLIEQDALTKLTGQTRQQAEAARAKAESEQRFRAVVESMRNSKDEKQIKAADELVRANQVLSSQSEEAGQGFRDLTTGMITTDAALKAYNSSNGEALKVATDMRAGEITAIDGVQQMAKAFGANAEALNSLAQSGVYEDFGIKFADSVKLGNIAMNDLTKMFEKIVTEQEEQGVEGKKALDELQQTQTEIRLRQKEAMQATQELVQLAVPAATTAMLKLAEAAAAAATALLATAKAKPANDALKEQATQSVYSNNELVGAAGEVGQVAAEGQIAAANQPAPEKIKSVKDMNFLDKFLVGKKEVARREAAEAAGQTPAQAAGIGTPKYAASLASNIAQFESGSAGYNAYNKGTVGNKMIGSDKPVDFSKMTIAEYLKRGDLKAGDPNRLFAVGKYQIVPETMKQLVKALKLDPDKTLLDATTQDLLFTEGLIKQKRQNVADYLAGRSDNRDAAILDLAMEFASVGVPYPAGKAKRRGESFYAGIGGNQAHNSPDAVGAALDADRQKNKPSAAAGGMFDGPMSGYPATLHGPEAVIPLKNGMVPVSINPTGLMSLMPSLDIDSETADQIAESFKTGMNVDFGDIVNSLNGLVRQQQDQNNLGLQERMISLLEDIRSSQVNTADNTGRMAAVAAN